MRDKPLRKSLAEIKQAQHSPHQKIQRIVPQIAFESILHCDVAYLKPSGLAQSRRVAVSSTQALVSQLEVESRKGRQDTFIITTMPARRAWE